MPQMCQFGFQNSHGHSITILVHLESSCVFHKAEDLAQASINDSSPGVVYWESTWVSPACCTLWGRSSRWESCNFFDFNSNSEVLPRFEYRSAEYAGDALDREHRRYLYWSIRDPQPDGNSGEVEANTIFPGFFAHMSMEWQSDDEQAFFA